VEIEERDGPNLFLFAEVETDGGRDILRAAEMTGTPLLRRLYLEHASTSSTTATCSVRVGPRFSGRTPLDSRRYSMGARRSRFRTTCASRKNLTPTSMTGRSRTLSAIFVRSRVPRAGQEPRQTLSSRCSSAILI
jgi:hypothetical protein